MLQSLFIKNFALIDSVTINFTNGFTVITGETGSGKSILLDGLGLILGKRADVSQLKNKEEKAVLEAAFLLDEKVFKPLFETNDLEFESNTIIRRELSPNGKSRLFVNDSPCLLANVVAISGALIDIHQQSEKIDFNLPEDKVKLLDIFAKSSAIYNQYLSAFNNWEELTKKLTIAKNSKGKQVQDLDYKTFLLKELSDLNLSTNEDLEALEEELVIFENHEVVIQGFSKVQALLYNDEINALQLLETALNELHKTERYSSKITDILQTFSSAVVEVKELESDLESFIDSYEANPERHTFLLERVNCINTLCQKHKVATIPELVAIRDELQQYVNSFNSSDDQIAVLEQKCKETESNVLEIGTVLQKMRVSACATFEKQIESELSALGMPKAKFKIVFTPCNTPQYFGLEEPDFTISTNPGMPNASIEKVVSGGEKSRIMLSLKSILSTAKQVLILDEIDSGVSGAVASKMGELMLKMATKRQVISVSHLPQVAAKANNHLKVAKKQFDTYTEVHVSTLNWEDRIKEIAELLGADTAEKSALMHAEQLMN